MVFGIVGADILVVFLVEKSSNLPFWSVFFFFLLFTQLLFQIIHIVISMFVLKLFNLSKLIYSYLNSCF